MKAIIFLVFLSCMASVHGQTPVCPHPKMTDDFCEYLQGLQDSSLRTIQIVLPHNTRTCRERGDTNCVCLRGDTSCVQGPVDLKKDTAQWNRIIEWSKLLFTTFDLRSHYYPDVRLPPPEDSAISPIYHLIRIPKSTILAVADASYVATLSFDHPIQVHILGRKNFHKRSLYQRKEWFDLKGRRTLGKSAPLLLPHFFKP